MVEACAGSQQEGAWYRPLAAASRYLPAAVGSLGAVLFLVSDLAGGRTTLIDRPRSRCGRRGSRQTRSCRHRVK
jgi:hypothetical protein